MRLKQECLVNVAQHYYILYGINLILLNEVLWSNVIYTK